MKVSGSFRDTVSVGLYTMINSSLDSITACIGSTVVSGQTYYYVAAARGCQFE